jgi:predicted dehydrogenase
MSTVASRRYSTSLARPKLGFLGVGWIGRHRLEAIAKTGVAEITAVSDVSPQAAEQSLAAAPSAEIVRSWEEMLAMDLDAIVIATPSAQHARQTVAALERGMAVFCQKPLGRNAAEAETVVAAAERADRLLAVDLSYRFIPGMHRIRNLVRSGELGDVFAVNLVFHNAYGPDKTWFYDRALSGGGCLLDLGIHLVDLALWTLDWPEAEVEAAALLNQGQPIAAESNQVEDFAAASLRLSSGAMLQLACSWKLSAGCDAQIEAAFYGTHGGAALRNVKGSFFDFTAERFAGTKREPLGGPDEPWFGQAAVDWARRLAAGERFDTDTKHLVDIAAMLDTIYERVHVQS